MCVYISKALFVVEFSSTFSRRSLLHGENSAEGFVRLSCSPLTFEKKKEIVIFKLCN